MVPNIMIELQVDRVDLVDEGANSAAFIKLYKRKENIMLKYEEILKSLKPEHQEVVIGEVAKAMAMVPEATTTALEEAKKAADDKTAELEGVKKSLKEYEDQIAKSKADVPFEEVLKGLDPAVQEVFKSIKAQKDAAEQVAKAASEKAENDMAIAKAKELKSLPVDEAKLATVLKGVSAEVMEILKAANAAIEGGELFSEVGKGKGNGDMTDAWSKIEKMAMTMATEEKITKAKAIAKVVKENPDMYKAYLNQGGAN